MREPPAEPDEPYPPPAPAFPGGVRAAGVLWVAVGGLFVLGSCAGAVLGVMIQARRPGPAQPNPAEGCTTLVGILIGVGFFLAGLNVLRGSARDTLVPSVLSILLGVVYLLVGVLALVLSGTPPANPAADMSVALILSGIIGTVMGCGLLLPAGLALAGRPRYLRWRAAQPSRSRRRRRYDPEDEPDEIRGRPRPGRGTEDEPFEL